MDDHEQAVGETLALKIWKSRAYESVLSDRNERERGLDSGWMLMKFPNVLKPSFYQKRIWSRGRGVCVCVCAHRVFQHCVLARTAFPA